MSEWIEKTIDEMIAVNPSIPLTKGQSYPFIDIDKVERHNKFVTNVEERIFDGQGGSRFQSGDTVFSRITPCLENRKIAKVKICEKSIGFGSTEFFVFRNKNGKTDSEFTHYLVSSDVVVLPAINSMTGASGRQRADSKFIKRLRIKFPPLPIQKQIGEILSAYDDAIENNSRRIVLLEKAAQELYKEWFVRFRFPRHETAKFESGLPKGWEIKRLADFGRIETGKTPPMDNPANYGDEIMFIKTPEMHNKIFIIKTEEYLSQKGHQTQPKKLLPPNSIMVSCIGSGGIVSLNAKEAHTNQQINSIIPTDKRFVEWLYFTCKGLKETIELFGATGTTMTNLSKGKFERLKVICPLKDLITAFHEKVNVILKQIKTLIYQNQNLTCQRDLLLPRLMSGKTEVKN